MTHELNSVNQSWNSVGLHLEKAIPTKPSVFLGGKLPG